MHHVLPYSDSCLYWCLAYIREGISDLRIYVTVTSPYPQDRGVTENKDLHNQREAQSATYTYGLWLNWCWNANLEWLACYYSIVLVFLHNRSYQSFSGSARDHVSIPRILWSVRRRSCVDLGALLVCLWDRVSFSKQHWIVHLVRIWWNRSLENASRVSLWGKVSIFI